MGTWMRLPLTIATAVGLLAAPAWAQDAAPPPPPPEAPDRPAAPAPPEAPEGKALLNPWYVYGAYGVNVVTYTGASGKTAASTVTPSDKVIQFEQVGVGYWVHPNIRVGLTGMFGETLTGLKPGASSFTLGAVIPCVFYTLGGFTAGGGPMFAPRAFGTNGFNYGLYTVVSYGLEIVGGLRVALAIQVPIFVEQKDSVAVTPALVLSERF
jgi:hypothetical protein